MFFGIRLLHERRHFLRAVMEGVAYSLRECLELLNNLGIDAEEIIASGGGAASPVWLQIQADILGKPVRACTVKEQACLGACILAGAGTGLLPSIEEGVKRFVTMSDLVYEPKQENFAVYEQRYKTFQQLYRQTKDLMR
jgi:xylulokinase